MVQICFSGVCARLFLSLLKPAGWGVFSRRKGLRMARNATSRRIELGCEIKFHVQVGMPRLDILKRVSIHSAVTPGQHR